MKHVTTILACAFFLIVLFFPKPVFAEDIVINEFSSDTAGSNADPDWVELFNKGSSLIDLSEYRLEDLNATNKKTLSGTIDSGKFAVVNWANSLNKAGDVISLIRISDASLIDKVAYGDQGSDVAAPGVGQSGGRQSDGIGSWVVFSSSTKGSSNNSSTPQPTSTPTLTPSPTPTNIPTPTKTPTPIKTPTPTKIPTPTASPKPQTQLPTPTTKPFVTSKPSTEDGDVLAASDSPEINLVLRQATESVEPIPTATVAGVSTRGNSVIIFFVIGGILFILSGILFGWKHISAKTSATPSE